MSSFLCDAVVPAVRDKTGVPPDVAAAADELQPDAVGAQHSSLQDVERHLRLHVS